MTIKHLVPLFIAALTWSTGASAYQATANIVLNFSGNGAGSQSNFLGAGLPVSSMADIGWTSNGTHTLSSVSNSTYFTTLDGYNSIGYYNSNFATTPDCAAMVTEAYSPISVRKYGCRWANYYGDVQFTPMPVGDDGPVGRASGTLTVSDSSLVGTLQLVSTTDEPTGPTTLPDLTITGARISNSIGLGTNGYNYRTADGSPFGNAWHGYTTAATLELSLTGVFTSTSWSITGGTMRFNDPSMACQQGGSGNIGDPMAGTLCTTFRYSGVYQNNGAHMSWGWDLDGSGTNTTISEIEVRDLYGTSVVSTLSGVLASITIDESGNIVTDAGEFRRASDPTVAGCQRMLRWNGARLVCGSLVVGKLDITGTVVPIPSTMWLMAGAVLATLGRVRRRGARRVSTATSKAAGLP